MDDEEKNLNDIFEGQRVDYESHSHGENEIAKSHPWIRFFARTFDFYGGIFVIFLLWVCIAPYSYLIVRHYLPEYVFNVLSYMFFIILESLLISVIGTTPGKWLFGINICDLNGQKLTFYKALKRSMYIFLKGLEILIPFYSIYTLYKSYKSLLEANTTPWDLVCSTEVTIQEEDTKISRIIINLTGGILYIGILYLILLSFAMQ